MGRRIFHEGKDFRISNGARRLGRNRGECRNEARRDGLLPALQVVGGEGALAVSRQRSFMSSLSKRRSQTATRSRVDAGGTRPPFMVGKATAQRSGFRNRYLLQRPAITASSDSSSSQISESTNVDSNSCKETGTRQGLGAMITIEKNRCIPASTPKAQSRPLPALFWELAGTISGTLLGTAGRPVTRRLSYT